MSTREAGGDGVPFTHTHDESIVHGRLNSEDDTRIIASSMSNLEEYPNADLAEGSLLSGCLGDVGGVEDEVSSTGTHARTLRSHAELLALVNYREQLITKVIRVIDLASSMNDKKLPVLSRDLVNISIELQEIGLKCVQRIIEWSISNSPPGARDPKQFLWHDGQPYLCKMLSDLDFIAEELPPSLRDHGNFRKGDPLFVSKTHNCSLSYRRSVYGATLVILDSVARASRDEGGRSRRSSSTWFSEDDEVSRARRRHFAKYGNNDNLDMDSLPSSEMNTARAAGNVSIIREDSTVMRGANAKLKPLAVAQGTSGSTKPSIISKRSNSSGVGLEGDKVVIFKGRMLYRRGKLLGEGAYAMVYSCERQDGKKYAVKVLRRETSTQDVAADSHDHSSESAKEMALNERIWREMQLLRRFKGHPNIVCMEEAFEFERRMFFVLQRMQCTLMELKVDRPFLTDAFGDASSTHSLGVWSDSSKRMVPGGRLWDVGPAAIIVVKKILCALEHLHSNNVIHRDIKPENILISESLSDPTGLDIKLGDLGSARELNSTVEQGPDLSFYVGNRSYRAPECLGRSPSYSFPSDIWSLGCTISEFVIGQPLFKGMSDLELLSNILAYEYFVPMHLRRSLEARKLPILPQVFKATDRPKIISVFDAAIEAKCLDTQFALLVAEGMLRFVETDRLSAAHLGAAMLDPTLNELI